MKFSIINFKYLKISRAKRVFEVKLKTFFLVSKVLSCKLKKLNSKNAFHITFKLDIKKIN